MDTKAKDIPVKEPSTFLLFLLFYILGTVSLVPQYFYITANDYWQFKFRDLSENSTDNDVKTDLQTNFTAYYSNVATICTNFFLVLTIIFSKKISVQLRIVGPLTIMMILFFVTLIFVWIDTDSWQHGFFYTALVIAGLLSATSGCFLISMYELSAKFPPGCLGAQISGESICGILAAVTQIFTLSLDVSSKASAMIYFSICAFVMAATIVFYTLVYFKSKSFQMYLNAEVVTKEQEKIDFSKFKIIFNKVILYVIPMVLTVGTSVMVFPGVTSLIESTGKGTSRWSDVFFVPVCSFLVYHVSDFSGREVALRWIQIKNIYVILAASLLRIGLIPLLMFCNTQPRNHLPVAFDQDYAFIIFLMVFASTNGYFLNMCLMRVPSVVEPEEKSLAMFIAIFAMILSSALCSFVVRALVHAL